MSVIIVVDGTGTPCLHFSPTFAIGSANSEATDLLKRGVLGHFEVIATPQSAIDAASELLKR